MNRWYQINWKTITIMSVITPTLTILLMLLFGKTVTLTNVAVCTVSFPVLILLVIGTETKKNAFLKYLQSTLHKEELQLEEARSALLDTRGSIEAVLTYIIILNRFYATKKAIEKTKNL
jgi:uncharacterized membrane protein